MGVTSVRFNSDEEKAIEALIEAFEVREDAGDTAFAPIDDQLLQAVRTAVERGAAGGDPPPNRSCGRRPALCSGRA